MWTDYAGAAQDGERRAKHILSRIAAKIRAAELVREQKLKLKQKPKPNQKQT